MVQLGVRRRSETPRAKVPSTNWNPKIIKYISPQVWASREGRSKKIARFDFDLVLSASFRSGKEWCASRVLKLRVEFIRHPLVERYGNAKLLARDTELSDTPNVLLLPGSRQAEVERRLADHAGGVAADSGGSA